jgi:hypothetical protein
MTKKPMKKEPVKSIEELGIGRRRLMKRITMGIASAAILHASFEDAEASCCSCDVHCNTCDSHVCAKNNTCNPNECNVNSCSAGHSCSTSNHNTCAPVSHTCMGGNVCNKSTNTCSVANVCPGADTCSVNTCSFWNACGTNTCTSDDWCTVNVCQTSDTDCGWWDISCPARNDCSLGG